MNINIPPDVKVMLRFAYKRNSYTMLTTKYNKIEYKTFLKYAKSQLKLHREDLKYLELHDEHGNIFDEVTFENYMMLYPITRQLFTVKLNYNKKITNEKRITESPLDDLFQLNCSINEKKNGNESSDEEDDFNFAIPQRPK